MKFDNTRVFGFKSAFDGMRFPMDSNYKSDSRILGGVWNFEFPEQFVIGNNDMKLAQKLILAGSPHDKFLRQISVWVEITAPLYFWSEMDTYKVGTVADSASTMHTLGVRPLEKTDFEQRYWSLDSMSAVLTVLNLIQEQYQTAKAEQRPNTAELLHHRLKAMLPSSFLQKRMWSANYSILRNIYFQRRTHRLLEWSEDFCKWVESLPYAKDLIMLEAKK